MKQIEVFISSTMDELAYERETAQEVIRRFSLSPSLFELFPAMSLSPTQAFLEGVRGCDLFVLILYREASKPVLAELQEAVACDKSIIVLVRASEGKRDDDVQKLLDGLRGRSKASVVPQYVYKEFGTLAQFREALRHALANEMSRRFQPPLHTMTREAMYDLGTQMVQCAQRRVAVYQRTPTYFLGCRPYGAPAGEEWGCENRFLEALNSWIARARKDRKREFVYAFSKDDTLKLMAAQPPALQRSMKKLLKDRLTFCKRVERESRQRLRFGPLLTESVPLAVGDGSVAFMLLWSEGTALCIRQENRAIADVMVRMLKMYMGQTSKLLC
jgi:hypothetical protein